MRQIVSKSGDLSGRKNGKSRDTMRRPGGILSGEMGEPAVGSIGGEGDADVGEGMGTGVEEAADFRFELLAAWGPVAGIGEEFDAGSGVGEGEVADAEAGEFAQPGIEEREEVEWGT